jgi:hypothetical protein
MCSEDEKEWTRVQSRAARNRGELVNPGVCTLCGLTKDPAQMAMHHWKGYGPDHILDVWFICREANSVISEHDGTSLEEIRKRYHVVIEDQRGFFTTERCNLKRVYRDEQRKICKSFRTFYLNNKGEKGDRTILKHFLTWYSETTGMPESTIKRFIANLTIDQMIWMKYGRHS